jgi:two-component system, sensor histidine kinase and response regulator
VSFKINNVNEYQNDDLSPLADQLRGRVLIAEDHPINREVLASFLTRMGLAVVLAENGAEAIELAIEQAFDLVLMDIQMPQINGLDAARHIKGLKPKLPIVAVTADINFIRESFANTLFENCLGKPIDQAQLVEVISDYLQVVSLSTTAPAKVIESANLVSDDSSPNADRLLDVQEGLRLVGGNPLFYHRMLDWFAAEMPQAYQAIKADMLALESLDANRIERLAGQIHRLKGGAASLAAYRVKEDLVNLQTFLVNREKPEKRFWDQLDQKIEQTLACVALQMDARLD